MCVRSALGPIIVSIVLVATREEERHALPTGNHASAELHGHPEMMCKADGEACNVRLC